MHKRMVYAVASHLSYKFYVIHIKDLGEILSTVTKYM